MTNLKRVILAFLVAAAALVGIGTQPASAMNAATIEFTLDVRTTPMGWPIITPVSNGYGTLSSTICVDTIAGKMTTAGPCEFNGSGTVTGNCNIWSGYIWGSLRLSNGSVVTYHLQVQTGFGAFVATGTVASANGTGIVVMEGTETPIPTIGGPSCATGTQTDFVLAGTATLAFEGSEPPPPPPPPSTATSLQFGSLVATAAPGTSTSLPFTARRSNGDPFTGTVRWSSGDVGTVPSYASSTSTDASGNGAVTVTATSTPIQIAAFADGDGSGSSDTNEQPGFTTLVGAPGLGGVDYPADDCTAGTVVADGFVDNVYVKVRTQAVDAQTTWVCVRADGGGVSSGGKFEVVAGAASPGVPTADTNAAACAAVPGNLTLSSGAIGDPGDPGYLDHRLDAYTTSGQAGLCVRVNTTGHRIVIPVGGVTPPATRFLPDAPGRHVPSPNAPTSQPSGTCQNGVGGTKHQFVNGTFSGVKTWAYSWQPTGSKVHLCVRSEGGATGGGMLTVDTGAASGSIPVVSTAADLTGCTSNIVDQTTGGVRVAAKRSTAAGLPASVCVVVHSTIVRVTAAAGAGNPAQTVTWAPDTA